MQKSRGSKPSPAGSSKVAGELRTKGRDMPTSLMSGFIQRHLGVLRDDAGLTERQLLEDYVSRRDEAAFAALVRRHGPMVWAVCRRVLGNHHDAEDAFQATFLVLVRRAASIASRELLANWLYGVARQTALKARANAAKRKVRERQAAQIPEPAASQRDPWRDVQPVLDEELSRLPDRYRGIIVLCDLEGKTRKEVAGQLGCPEGTVASRLVRARAMLAKRLAQRGVALSSGTLAATLAQQATASMPNAVADSTIKAASLLAAGKAAATGAVSVHVAALTEGVLKAMLFTKLKAAVAVLLVLGFLATGATILTCRTAAGTGKQELEVKEPEKQPQKKDDKKGITAWGKEVGGLQAGLGFPAGQKRVYSQGETIKVVLRVRNVGKKAVEFKHIWAFFVENPPKITDADGKMVQLPNYRTRAEGSHVPRNTNVAPGKEVELYEWTFDLQPNGENSSRSFIHGTGQFSLQCERIVGPTWLNPSNPNPAMSKLATGKLELEVKDDPPAQKQDKQPVKEGFTAWGKEVDGLQAGLDFRPGQKRAYRHGETVKLVVRVRNVGKEAVEFQYVSQFLIERPPAVTDGKGKVFPTGARSIFGVHLPKQVNLAPGKEIELYGELEVRTDFGTGKVSVQYKRVFGNSSSGKIKLDPILSELATGKMELEIKADPPPAASEKPRNVPRSP